MATKDGLTSSDPIALAVDLDGSLVSTDLLLESMLFVATVSIRRFIRCLLLVFRGKAAMKQAFAREAELSIEELPYHPQVLSIIEAARASGRKTILATAADRKWAEAIASHLGVFDAYLASDGETNLSGRRKLDSIVHAAGPTFEYVGDSYKDLPIWSQSVSGVAVAPSRLLRRSLKALNVKVIDTSTAVHDVKEILRLIRPKQWAKNLLLFVPLLLSHQWQSGQSVLNAVLAFVAFSLCASAIYVVNDLTDLQSDRKHLRKKHRPLACGSVSIKSAVLVALGLVLASAGVSILISWGVFSAIAGYALVTVAYSAVLKSKLLADVLALAFFYTYRVLVGGIATGVVVSHWLLAFCAFFFLSLALAKRTAELLEVEVPPQVNARRGYRIEDLPVLLAFGISSAVASMLVFCMYISGETAVAHYSSPECLWLAVPLLLYWVMRLWFLVQRRDLNDDPLMFAFRDSNTHAVVLLIAAVFGLAVLA